MRLLDLLLLATGVGLALASRHAFAQATVSGRVAVLERAGARTDDLENAVLWLEPLDAARSGAPTSTEIVMASRQFRPAVRVIPSGSEVRFPNADPFRHNVFSDAGPTRFDLGLYGRGQTKAAKVEKAGVYPVFCNVHAKMVAYLVAVPTRWYTQAGSDGSYQIADVPPGRYRLHAWHDRGGQQTRDLTVAAAPVIPAHAGITADVQLDARGWRSVAHKNKYGQDYPPESRDRY